MTRTAIRFNRASEFPTISTAPSIASIRGSANRPYLPAGAARAKGDFVLPFDVSYELDFWGRVRRTVASAREFAQASAADLETAKLSLQAELAFDYFELRSADELQNIIERSVILCTGDTFWVDEAWLSSQDAPCLESSRPLTQNSEAMRRNSSKRPLRKATEKLLGQTEPLPNLEFRGRR